VSPDSSDDLPSVLRDLVRQQTSHVYTALPARVESYTASKQTAAVQPMVRSELGQMPVLPRVPVLFARAGGLHVTLPVEVGDTGLLIITSLDAARWRATGALSDPPDHRRGTLASAVFLPGYVPAQDALPAPGGTTVDIGADGGSHVAVSRSDRTDADIQRLQADIITLKAAMLSIVTTFLDPLYPSPPAPALPSAVFSAAAATIPQILLGSAADDVRVT